MRRFVFAVAALVAISSLSQASEAQDDGTFSWLLEAGAGRFTGDYGLDDDTTVDLLNFSARWYLPRAELQLSVPYLRIDGPADLRFIAGQPVAVPGEPAGVPGEDDSRTESGIGDLVLQGEYYLRMATESGPWVIGRLRYKAPTGDEDRGLGTGAADVEAALGLIQPHGPVNWLADVGYTWVGSSSTFELRDVLRVGAGVAMSFGPNDRHNSYVYLENRTNMVRGSDDRRSLALGLGTALDRAQRVRVSASLFFGLSDTAEDVGVYVTLGRRL